MMDAFTDYDSSDEERLVRDSVRRMVQESRKPIVNQGAIEAPGSHARTYFQDLEALGLSELMLSEGGIDVPMVRRIAIISEEAGAGLFITPVVESIGLPLLGAAGLLQRGANTSAPGTLLTAIAEPFSVSRVLPTAIPDSGGNLRLSGSAARIPFAPMADGFLVAAEMRGTLQLLLVPAKATGSVISAEPMADGSDRGQLVFDGCLVGPDCQLAQGAAAQKAIDLLLDVLLLSTAAQLAGISARVQDMACEHIRTRHQFGRALAAFQALQHRAANDYVAVEVTRAFLYQVCDIWNEGDTRRALLHALLVKAAQTAIDVAKSTIQMHGAMGFTLEHEVGWYLKAAIALSTRYGDLAAHRRLFADCNIAFW